MKRLTICITHTSIIHSCIHVCVHALDNNFMQKFNNASLYIVIDIVGLAALERGRRELCTLVVMGVTRMRISADPCGTIRKRNADLGIARCIDEVRYGGCRILCIGYLYYQDFTLDSIYLCCCSWVPIKVGIKQFTFD